MKKLFTTAVIALCLPSLSAMAQTVDETTLKHYDRNSIYTFLIKSDKQNSKLDEELTTSNNVVTELVTTFKKNKADTTNLHLSEMPQTVFPTIEIPDQFYDHNLELRVLDLDPITASLTDDAIKAANEEMGIKKSKAGKFFGGMGKAALGNDTKLINTDSTTEAIPAALKVFFAQDNTAAKVVAKWFDYDASRDAKWDQNLVTERGFYGAKAEEIAEAKLKTNSSNNLAGKGFDLIPKTYVIGVNLAFRSNQAIVAEAQAVANTVGSMFGGIGQLAAQAGGAIAGAAAGQGYSVQANCFLYKLEWNDDVENRFSSEIFSANASLEDLIASGMCKLIPMGKEKATARVRQSITNSRPMQELVRISTAQAIDKAICKLQEKVEDFRTVTPISATDPDGTIYAKIGTKEGLAKNDEYDILEAQEQADGTVYYKSIGTAKVLDKRIWENRFGVASDISDISDDDAKADDLNKDAVALGATAFKGGKKGQDYTGYFLRLKKKK